MGITRFFVTPWGHPTGICSHAVVVNVHWKPCDPMNSYGLPLVTIGFQLNIFVTVQLYF